MSEPTLSSQLNWNNWSRAQDPFVAEYPFYSDANIKGEFREGLGPYSFLSAFPDRAIPGTINVPIILRVEIHLPEWKPEDISGTDESLYYGGAWVDEIAALTSVALGVRIHAGTESRRFGPPFDDPYGQPLEKKNEPVFRAQPERLILPSVALDTHSMDQLEILESIPRIDPKKYVNLIRACRSYQNALWIAESEPNLAWLMFVSALETAANDFYKNEAGSSEQLLKDLKPDLANRLIAAGGDELIREVAEDFADMFRATKKFIDFAVRFSPDPPATDQRPSAESLQINWTESGLKKIFDKVYKYRSRSLHVGIPFPDPMLRPSPTDSESPPPEVPLGLASSSMGGTWDHNKYAPINLHCFHYITRKALLKWWKTHLAE